MHMVVLGLLVYTFVILHTLYFGSVATLNCRGAGGDISVSYRGSVRVVCCASPGSTITDP
jgi:hypothetical protein